MEISIQYNRFYHGIALKQAFEAVDYIYFADWKDTNTGGVLKFDKWVDYHDIDDLKQLFKLMNISYPVDGDKKLSTTKADPTLIMRHIDFVIRTMGQNSIELQFVKDEWELLKRQAGIYYE